MLNGHTLTALVYDTVNVESESNIGSNNGATLYTITPDSKTWTSTRITTTLGIAGVETSAAPVSLTWDPIAVNVFVSNEIVAQQEALAGALSAGTSTTTIQTNLTYLNGLNLLGSGQSNQNVEGTSTAGGVNPVTPSV